MTSQISKTTKRVTACYDLPPDLIELVRKIAQQLACPAGDVVAWCILTAVRQGNPVQTMTGLRVATMTPGRFAFRLKIR